MAKSDGTYPRLTGEIFTYIKPQQSIDPLCLAYVVEEYDIQCGKLSIKNIPVELQSHPVTSFGEINDLIERQLIETIGSNVTSSNVHTFDIGKQQFLDSLDDHQYVYVANARISPDTVVSTFVPDGMIIRLPSKQPIYQVQCFVGICDCTVSGIISRHTVQYYGGNMPEQYMCKVITAM